MLWYVHDFTVIINFDSNIILRRRKCSAVNLVQLLFRVLLRVPFNADIDECSLNDTLCHQLCNNTDGGYFCSCRRGYQLIEGSNQCEGVSFC